MPKSKKSKLDDRVEERVKSEQSDADESDSSISTEVVQTDFEAFAPTENDFDGIRSLLQQLLPIARINLTELTNTIINQSHIGCVHKVALDDNDDGDMDVGDEDIYGLVTVVDATSDEAEWARQFKSMLQKHYAESTKRLAGGVNAATKAAFDQLWKSETPNRIGWVINERLVNIPFQIAAPSFESLLEELDNSQAKYDVFIAVLKIHKLNASGADGESSSSGNATGKGGRGSSKKHNKGKDSQRTSTSPVVYANCEEELLFEECDCSFDYSVSSEVEGGSLGERSTDDGSYKPYRRVVLFDREAFGKFLNKLKALANQ